MRAPDRKMIQALSSITQLGISVVVSFFIWIFIASWLKKTFDLGNAVMVIGIICGAGSGVMSFVNFCRRINHDNKNSNKQSKS
ncbi:MAG: AtpZ/AtpI family protein [Clostridia bacterium]|nr:AtpZ/AtpI family protein [Clostridia bacterium]